MTYIIFVGWGYAYDDDYSNGAWGGSGGCGIRDYVITWLRDYDYVWSFAECVIRNPFSLVCIPGIGAVAYWGFGFAFAFGAESNPFIGYRGFFLENVPSSSYSFFFFQFVFAATGPTIVAGALAERTRFVAYFVYSFFITGRYILNLIIIPLRILTEGAP